MSPTFIFLHFFALMKAVISHQQDFPVFFIFFIYQRCPEMPCKPLVLHECDLAFIQYKLNIFISKLEFDSVVKILVFTNHSQSRNIQFKLLLFIIFFKLLKRINQDFPFLFKIKVNYTKKKFRHKILKVFASKSDRPHLRHTSLNTHTHI